MDADIVIGIVVIAGALAALTFLLLWSRRRIERIARNGFASARTIEEELRGGR